MPRPNNPSTEKARAASLAGAERRRIEKAIALLTEAGYTITKEVK